MYNGEGMPHLSFTAGVHPHDAKTCTRDTISQLTRMATDPNMVAIGECGLDFDRNFSPQEEQERWFEEQIKLAIQLKKPLYLHERSAHDVFVRILSKVYFFYFLFIYFCL
jgi:TatD DNase family protein